MRFQDFLLIEELNSEWMNFQPKLVELGPVLEFCDSLRTNFLIPSLAYFLRRSQRIESLYIFFNSFIVYVLKSLRTKRDLCISLSKLVALFIQIFMDLCRSLVYLCLSFKEMSVDLCITQVPRLVNNLISMKVNETDQVLIDLSYGIVTYTWNFKPSMEVEFRKSCLSI